jgi:hypothetical protein
LKNKVSELNFMSRVAFAVFIYLVIKFYKFNTWVQNLVANYVWGETDLLLISRMLDWVKDTDA